MLILNYSLVYRWVSESHPKSHIVVLKDWHHPRRRFQGTYRQGVRCDAATKMAKKKNISGIGENGQNIS